MPTRSSRRSIVLLAMVALASCGGDPGEGQSSATTSTSTSTSAGTGGSGGGSTGQSGGGAPGDAGTDTDAATVDDGTPTRMTCTSTFGNALNTYYGRLDGYLVSIVPLNTHSCNGDSGHLHLQVLMKGAVYDVAVNTDTLYAEKDAAFPGGPWSEGWHTSVTVDYPTTFGLHSGGFTTTNPAALVQWLDTELASANHITIFATGYGPTGAHDVHRRDSGRDGVIAINPLSATPHLLLFRFSTDSF